MSKPTGSPRRVPSQNAACGFPALRSRFDDGLRLLQCGIPHDQTRNSRDIALLETYRALRSHLFDALALIDREIDAMEAGFAAFERHMDALREED